jgi:hypothetical protein
MSATTNKTRTNARTSRRASKPSTRWRAKAATMLGQVSCIIQGTLDLNEGGMWAQTEMLLLRAQAVHASLASMVASFDHSRDEVCGESFELLALLRGARALAMSEDVPQVLVAALDSAITLVDEASGENPYLDGPSDDDTSPQLKVVQAAQPEPVITAKTELPHGGEIAADMMRHCTFEIESLSHHIVDLADEDGDAEHTPTATLRVMRVAGLRISRLNSLLMSYLTEDTVTLQEAACCIDGDTRKLSGKLELAGSQQ